jgi:hypothetical protein
MRRTLRAAETANPLAEDPATPMPADRRLLTSLETAAALKVSPRTLSYWTTGRRPRLPYVKLGKAKRFVAADIIHFIEKHRIRAA